MNNRRNFIKGLSALTLAPITVAFGKQEESEPYRIGFEIVEKAEHTYEDDDNYGYKRVFYYEKRCNRFALGLHDPQKNLTRDRFDILKYTALKIAARESVSSLPPPSFELGDRNTPHVCVTKKPILHISLEVARTIGCFDTSRKVSADLAEGLDLLHASLFPNNECTITLYHGEYASSNLFAFTVGVPIGEKIISSGRKEKGDDSSPHSWGMGVPEAFDAGLFTD